MRHIIHHAIQQQKEGGFVLLLTMLIISVMLTISLSVFNITIKDAQISSFMHQSERALAAADRGLECALFWDRATSAAGGLQYTPFPTSSAWTATSINMANVTCNNGTGDVQLNSLASWAVGNVNVQPVTTVFTMVFSNGASVDMSVQKNGIVTTVIANGYNTSDVTNLRRTQRTLAASYNF